MEGERRCLHACQVAHGWCIMAWVLASESRRLWLRRKAATALSAFCREALMRELCLVGPCVHMATSSA